jgi:hypothetical protein
MICALEQLKEKIITGKVSNKDIDIVNDVIKYIEEKEAIQNLISESLIESEECMTTDTNKIEIGTVNIYYSQEKKTVETE